MSEFFQGLSKDYNAWLYRSRHYRKMVDLIINDMPSNITRMIMGISLELIMKSLLIKNKILTPVDKEFFTHKIDELYIILEENHVILSDDLNIFSYFQIPLIKIYLKVYSDCIFWIGKYPNVKNNKYMFKLPEKGKPIIGGFINNDGSYVKNAGTIIYSQIDKDEMIFYNSLYNLLSSKI